MNEHIEGDRAEEPRQRATEFASQEMPRYQCHKKVWALKIEKLELDVTRAAAEGRETDGGAWISPENHRYGPIKVSAEYVTKHKPQAGGYYVVYKGGDKSFLPAQEFEEGYSLI